MVIKDYIFTSESVSEGHPDKVADQISDAILDEHIKGDKRSRVALETLVTTDRIVLSGEVTSKQAVDYREDGPPGGRGHRLYRREDRVRRKDLQLPGVRPCPVARHSPRASPRGRGSSRSREQGDQGMMFGYAVGETKELMPMPILLAHKLVKRLADVRRSGELKFIRPDSKSQVTIQYVDGKPKRVDAVVISTQHTDDVTHQQITEGVIETTIKKIIPAGFIDNNTKIYVNPTGRFVVGGPQRGHRAHREEDHR